MIVFETIKAEEKGKNEFSRFNIFVEIEFVVVEKSLPSKNCIGSRLCVRLFKVINDFEHGKKMSVKK